LVVTRTFLAKQLEEGLDDDSEFVVKARPKKRKRKVCPLVNVFMIEFNVLSSGRRIPILPSGRRGIFNQFTQRVLFLYKQSVN
jgi:hypothetical protein